MKKGTVLFLKITVFIIGLITISLCIFVLPKLATYTAEMNPEFAYLKYPVLIGLYVSAVPFFLALFKALELLGYIENNNSFSQLSIKALKAIKYCAFTISVLYVVGGIILFLQNSLHPSIAIIGLIIVFISIIIATFTAVLQMLLKNALDIKSENDLTV